MKLVKLILALSIVINVIVLVFIFGYGDNPFNSKLVQPEIVTTTITIHYYEDIEDIPANNDIRREDMNIGYAIWSAETAIPRTCDIHVVKPKNLTDRMRFETLGHELFHCTHHHFHKDTPND